MRRQMILTALFSVLILLAACGTTVSDDEEKEDPVVDSEEQPVVEVKEEQPVVEVKDEDVDESDPNEDSGDLAESDTDMDQGENKITETGIYNGQADPHTIEIETEEGPTAFQLTMEAREDIDALTIGGKVKYTYTKDGDHREIEKIQMND